MAQTSIETSAQTVDEAVAQALAELNLSRSMVDVEILDEGSRGVFGIGARPVRVLVSLQGSKPPKADKKPVQPTALKPDVLSKPKGAPAKKAESKSEPRSVTPSADMDEVLTYAHKVVTDLVYGMKLEAHVSVSYGEKNRDGDTTINVDINGDDLSVLIGARSETLNALQYIAGLIISKKAGLWVQVVADVEGYRARRDKQLRVMANKMADQAVKMGKRQTLEPMPSSERRIIHMELRNRNDVISESVGEEPSRKVTISPK
jgi:spoIIIJ-associated protein